MLSNRRSKWKKKNAWEIICQHQKWGVSIWLTSNEWDVKIDQSTVKLDVDNSWLHSISHLMNFFDQNWAQKFLNVRNICRKIYELLNCPHRNCFRCYFYQIARAVNLLAGWLSFKQVEAWKFCHELIEFKHTAEVESSYIHLRICTFTGTFKQKVLSNDMKNISISQIN